MASDLSHATGDETTVSDDERPTLTVIDDIDIRCNAIIEEAMRRVMTLRGEYQHYALAYSGESKHSALYYLTNAGHRGAMALLKDCQRGLSQQQHLQRRLDS